MRNIQSPDLDSNISHTTHLHDILKNSGGLGDVQVMGENTPLIDGDRTVRKSTAAGLGLNADSPCLFSHFPTRHPRDSLAGRQTPDP